MLLLELLANWNVFSILKLVYL